MKVSIITCCYNRVNTIRGAIESVLAQDYPNIEYIVIDGASNDGSLEVINEYRDRISVIVSEPDHGMYEAINKGIRLATGDIVALVHSDDFLYDDHVVSDVVKEFERSQADFLYADGLFVDADNTDRVVRNWIGGNYKRGKVKFGWLPLHPTCYIKRSIIELLGQYDETYKMAADTDFLIRYLYEARLQVTYLHRYVVRMRMGGMSTDRSRMKAMWKEDIAIMRKHGFSPVPTKLMKMMWKVPQFISAKFISKS